MIISKLNFSQGLNVYSIDACLINLQDGVIMNISQMNEQNKLSISSIFNAAKYFLRVFCQYNNFVYCSMTV